MSKIMGQRIHDKREAAGLTVEELADKIGVSRQTVYKWEKGMVKNIDRDYIGKMAAIFHCDPEWLMHMEDSKEVSIIYSAPGREPIEALIKNPDTTPIIGPQSKRAALYKVALEIKPENLDIAIEILKSLI